jgi:hypothetical protein
MNNRRRAPLLPTQSGRPHESRDIMAYPLLLRLNHRQARALE